MAFLYISPMYIDEHLLLVCMTLNSFEKKESVPDARHPLALITTCTLQKGTRLLVSDTAALNCICAATEVEIG
jgi:hypothetical protein